MGRDFGLATEARNKPAQAGVSGKLIGQMPETVTSRPYSGLRKSLPEIPVTEVILAYGASLVTKQAVPTV